MSLVTRILFATLFLGSTTGAFLQSSNTIRFGWREKELSSLRASSSREDGSISRRIFLIASGLLGGSFSSSAPARAIMANDSKEARVFSAGEALGVEDSKARFTQARKDARYLLENYEDIVKAGGGDNVRRYLGTVGVTSAMYGIQKVMKELQEEADDVVEYTESMQEFEAALRAADTACYSANFVEFSSAKTKPEKFFADAKYETKRMLESMDIMARELKL